MTIYKNETFVCTTSLENGLYLLNLKPNLRFNSKMFRVEQTIYKRQKNSPNDDMYHWHLRLGHISLD